MLYNFEWDPKKASSNNNKHKVSFELAATIFNDPMALSLFDEKHSSKVEERWVSIGISSLGNLLVVVHTFKEVSGDTSVIRIISARKATKNERKQYEGKENGKRI